MERRLHSEGKISEASKRYQYLLDQGFNDPRVLSNLGVILQQTGQIDRAITLYKKSIKMFPAIPESYSNLGNILKNSGKLEEAEKYYLEGSKPLLHLFY